MASDGCAAVFTAYYDIWNADANKLGGANANAQVKAFLEEGDPSIRRTPEGLIATQTCPMIVVSVNELQQDSFGTGTRSLLRGEFDVTLRCFFRRNRTVVEERVTIAQLIDKYHERAIQSANVTALGWVLQKPCRLRGFWGPSAGERRQWIEQHRVQGSTTDG